METNKTRKNLTENIRTFLRMYKRIQILATKYVRMVIHVCNFDRHRSRNNFPKVYLFKNCIRINEKKKTFYGNNYFVGCLFLSVYCWDKHGLYDIICEHSTFRAIFKNAFDNWQRNASNMKNGRTYECRHDNITLTSRDKFK